MPYAMNDTTRIYYEIVGRGSPLVLYHGTTQWSGIWRSLGYVDALHDSYQLVLIDARGHGESSKPVDGDYSFETQAGDVIAVLDECDIESAHFFGYSTGGLVGYRLGLHHPERMRSLIIGGAQPYATPPEAREMLTGFSSVIEQGLHQLVAAYEQMTDPMPAGLRDQLLASDPEVFLGYIQNEINAAGLTDDELAAIVTPALVYAGSDDEPFAGSRARRSAEVMPNASYHEVPDADHLAAQFQAEMALPMISDFLRSVDDTAPLSN